MLQYILDMMVFCVSSWVVQTKLKYNVNGGDYDGNLPEEQEG